MIDQEKVRKGIAFCLSRFHCGEDCPYYDAGKTGCMESLQKDTLELLKEQEPIYPNLKQTVEAIHFTCGNCGMDLMKGKYCPECGRRVKWDAPD